MAYLDNELSPSEARQIASLLSTDPDARSMYNELKDTKEVLAGNETLVPLPEILIFIGRKSSAALTPRRKPPLERRHAMVDAPARSGRRGCCPFRGSVEHSGSDNSGDNHSFILNS